MLIFIQKGPLFSPDRQRLLYNEQNEPTSAAKEIHCPKTCHHSQIENALCLWRLFQVTLVSPLMSLGHYGSELVIISPVRASGTTLAPISCRSLLGGRDLSSNNLIIGPYLFGLQWNTYVFLSHFITQCTKQGIINYCMESLVLYPIDFSPTVGPLVRVG